MSMPKVPAPRWNGAALRERWDRVVRWRPALDSEVENSKSVAPIAAALAALVVASVVAVGLRDTRALRPGEVRLVLHRASVDVGVGGKDFRRVHTTMTLHTGDRLRVVSGEPELQLARNTRADLRTGSAVRVGSAAGPALSLETGDLLVHGPLDISTTEAVAHVTGIAKLTERSGVVAGAYQGDVALDAIDAPALTIKRYRQAVVLGLGGAPTAAEPLRVDDADKWDRRLLGDVLDLDSRLESFARGLDAQLPAGSGQTAGFYRTMLPSLAHDDLPATLLAPRSAGENLIGLTLVSLDHGTFAERVNRIFGFRDEGARWGLVAADRGLNPPDVLAHFQQALGRAPAGRAIPLSRLTATPIGAPNGTGGGKPPTGGGGPPTTQPPSTPTTLLPPITTGIPPVDNATRGIQNILEGLLGGILPPPPPASGSANAPTTTGLLGAVVGGVTGLLG